MRRYVRDLIINPEDKPFRWEEMLRGSFLPERYWTSSGEKICESSVSSWLNKVRTSMPHWLIGGKGFYIHGDWEVGKSSLAAILLMDALRRCEKCVWVRAREIPSIMFHDMGSDPVLDRIKRALRDCDLCVVDDFGADSYRVEGPAGSAFESVFREVYDRGRSVIITSNFSWTQFYTVYAPKSEAIVSIIERLVEPVGIVNPQWRKERGS